MKNFKKILPSLCLMMFSATLYAGNDDVPLEVDGVLFDCQIQPVKSRDSRDPFAPTATNLGIALIENGDLYINPYVNLPIQKFGLVYSGQGNMLNGLPGGGQGYEIANKWRIIGHSTFRQCWKAVGLNADNDTIVGRTCNPDEDGGDWAARDFYLTSAGIGVNFTSSGKRIINIRRAGANFQFLHANTFNQISQMFISHVIRPGDDFKTRDFTIDGCKNRNGIYIDPMKYNN